MVDFKFLIPKEKLLEQIRDAQQEFGISSSAIGRNIGLSQPTMSNLLNPKTRNPRDLSYDDAYAIIQYLTTRISIIPQSLRLSDIMTDANHLEWANSDQNLNEASELMFKKGFSQIPVRDAKTLQFIGVITELSILKRLMRRSGENTTSLEELGRMSIIEAGIVENVLKCPLGSSLSDATNILISYPAILVTSKNEDIVGILTRSDLLKLFTRFIP